MTSKIKVAIGNLVSTLGSGQVSFSLGRLSFTNQFTFLLKFYRHILILLVFEKNTITVDPKTQTLSLLNMTLQLNEISSTIGNVKKI